MLHSRGQNQKWPTSARIGNISPRGNVPSGHTPTRTHFPANFRAGATMVQVCFTAISSNRACPAVFIALSSV